MKKFFINKLTAKFFLPTVLRLDTFLYKLATVLAITREGGKHPKHRILRYSQWFSENVERGEVILDVGCNRGSLTQALSEKAQHIYGIEINESLFRRAQQENSGENITYIHADATTYDYSSIEKISLITLSNVLEHIEHRIDFLKDIMGSVRWEKEPCFLIRVPMRDREWLSIYKRELGLEWRLDTTHFTEYTEKEFREEMEEVGLVIKSVEVRFGELYAICHKKTN